MNPEMKEKLLKYAQRVDVICILVIVACLGTAAYLYVTEQNFQAPPPGTAAARQFQSRFPNALAPNVENPAFAQIRENFIEAPETLRDHERFERLLRLNLFAPRSVEEQNRFVVAFNEQRLAEAERLRDAGNTAAALRLVDKVLEELSDNSRALALREELQAAVATPTPEPFVEENFGFDQEFF